MKTLAYSYGHRSIRSVDLATKSEWLLQKLTYNAAQFDIADDGTIFYVCKNGFRQIRQAVIGSASVDDALYYEHSAYVRDVAVRRVDGALRVYFSAIGPNGINAIFYLSESKTPIQYYVINPDDIALYNPCTGQEDWPYYRGDFTFGQSDTLYISNGNCSPCAIYRITGASPDYISGGVERIYQSEDAIESLACKGDYLYFRQSTKTISELGTVVLWSAGVYTVNIGGVDLVDIAIGPDHVLGAPPAPYFRFVRFAKWIWSRISHPAIAQE